MGKKILQIGGGKMGSIWAKSFNEYGDLIGLVDPDEKTNNLAEKYNIERFSNIEDTNKKADIWCIATPIQYHHKYISKAIQEDIDSILVEKPATLHPVINNKILENSGNTKINVDYIELENIVYKSILKDISKSGFNLSEAIHWRGKNIPSNLFPFMRNELVHDISEIAGLYHQQNKDFSKIKVEDVFDIKLWNEETKIYNDYDEHNIYDIQGSVCLKGTNNESIYITGGFNEQYDRRYFLWIDNNQNIAYLASTISRDNLTPLAVRIKGEKDIKLAKEKCANGLLRNNVEFNELVNKTDSMRLTTKNKLPSYTIARKIIHGKTSPITLSKANDIENLMFRIYQQDNTPNLY